jgi:hypothetical protein
MNIDKAKFIFLYEQQYFKFLTDTARAGLTDLLALLGNDPNMVDVRWVGYCLATTFHETAGTWLPVEEYGKGKGLQYGVPDKRTGRTYYGRGYTQNTWYDNYKMLTDAWNKLHPQVPVDFTQHPDLLCIPEYAYWAMSYAMRNGSYTGVGLKRYFNDTTTDPINARKIINGTDKAALIANYYDMFMKILTGSVQDA